MLFAFGVLVCNTLGLVRHWKTASILYGCWLLAAAELIFITRKAQESYIMVIAAEADVHCAPIIVQWFYG